MQMMSPQTVKRVCVVGAESTGTTTLAQQLAAHYHTEWVPEYGREYSERLAAEGVDLWHYRWRSEEFTYIARLQLEREEAAAEKVAANNAAAENSAEKDASNLLLICDTDALATAIWHERYMGIRSPEVEAMAMARHYDLYILTGCEIPFVQDGIRDGENIRQWMTGRFEEELEGGQRRWIKVSGTAEERLQMAIAAVDALLEPTC
jgi:NadR type nicotinamide-nucleotide adenylyltransferase